MRSTSGTDANNNAVDRMPRPRRVPSIRHGDESDQDGSLEDFNASGFSIATTSTCSTNGRDRGLDPSSSSRRRRSNSRLDCRLTKSMSTPVLRSQTSLDAISRAERRSNREQRRAMDRTVLLTERRSLSPIARFRNRDRRPQPSRLSQLGHHTFYHRDDDDDDDDDNDESDNNNKATSRRRCSKIFTRRTTLPGNIKPMENYNQSDVIEPNAIRYLPKILRDIYAQRQIRRPSSDVSIFECICYSSYFSSAQNQCSAE